MALTACRGGTGRDVAQEVTAPAPTSAQASSQNPDGTPKTGRYLAAEAAVARIGIYSRPGDGNPLLTLAHPNPIGAPLTFAVLSGRDGWLEVRLPVRPNGSTGWLRSSDVTLIRHSFRVEVRLAERVLTVFDGDDVIQAEPIGVGGQPTPTPSGEFYLYELVRSTDPNGPFGPYAFGLSGFCTTIDAINAGEGRLGLHGTNEPSSLGSSTTNGGIRLANAAIEQLARTVPLGTPVVIFA